MSAAAEPADAVEDTEQSVQSRQSKQSDASQSTPTSTSTSTSTKASKRSKRLNLRASYIRQRVPIPDKPPGHHAAPRLPKRKVALLLGFNGTGYSGMQINPGAHTVEAELFSALVAAGAVSAANAADPKKVGFHRSARTDKGVHAAGQVVSLKMLVDVPDLLDRINAHLPRNKIRVWGWSRVVKGFNAKNTCDSRIYEYLLPTYVFMPPDAPLIPRDSLPLSNADVYERMMARRRERPDAVFEDGMHPARRLAAEQMAAKRAFRISSDTVRRIHGALQSYVGSHQFHNFTVDKTAGDPSTQRNIRSFEVVGEPFVGSDNNSNGDSSGEWLRVRVHGVSFMMHQIRKMIGLVILLVRTGHPDPASAIRWCLSRDTTTTVPKAPGLGLLLDRVVFDSYNLRYGTLGDEAAEETVDETADETAAECRHGKIYANRNPNRAEHQQSVTFAPYEPQIEAFKRRFIHDALMKTELDTDCFDLWTRDMERLHGALPYLDAERVQRA